MNRAGMAELNCLCEEQGNEAILLRKQEIATTIDNHKIPFVLAVSASSKARSN